MALLFAEVDFDVVEIVLRDKPAEMLALSPKGTVPVLCLPDRGVLEESWSIMHWALVANDPFGWWARGQTAENLAWLSLNDNDFKQSLDRYKYPERFGELNRNQHRDHAVTFFLAPLERALQKSNYLGGKLPCVTDIAIFPFVRQFAAVEPLWFKKMPLPAVQAWLALWQSSQLFQSCMVKLPSNQVLPFPLIGEAAHSAKQTPK